jgi:hypothetical protein
LRIFVEESPEIKDLNLFFPIADLGGEITSVNAVVTLVTSGGFGALVWYLIAKALPAMEDRHATERKEILDAHEAERKEWMAYVKGQNEKNEELIKQYHELMVKSFGDFTDVISRFGGQ